MAEVFSLEDDYGDIFITQSDKVLHEDNSDKSDVEILPDPMDFSSPCVSLVSKHNDAQYSDISDDDMFEIPSSQTTTSSSTLSTR